MQLPTKLIVLTSLLIGFLCFSPVSFAKAEPWQEGSVVEDITLPLLNGEGEVNLADLRGKVVYFDFWASWCKPCIQSFPLLDDIYKRYKDQGFTVIAVNVDFNPEKGKEFAVKHPVSYPVVLDNQKLLKKAKINAMPTAFYIDKKGVIRLVHRGFIPGDEKKIEKAIAFLLNEK